jgi:hypothetical protein
MAISTMDAHGHNRHHHHHHHHASPLRGHSAMSIGHLTKINTLVMVGPAGAKLIKLNLIKFNENYKMSWEGAVSVIIVVLLATIIL